MDETWVGLMEIAGPAILLILLIWLVLRRRSSRTTKDLSRGVDEPRTDAGTRRVYEEEEQRRREGTDGL